MQIKYKPNRILHALPLTLLASALSTALYAEEEEEVSGLNVVIVTATKRPENSQDIPISLSVVSAEQLKSGGIEKIEDLQYKVPNLQMTETGVSTQVYIRGIGTGNNQGFEQSVGQYIDGIYYGRQQLIRAPFLDLERVEVLRGPQSILFGKNSIAGALNMTSAKPTEDLEVRLGLQFIPEFGSNEITAVVSGGLSDTVSGRLAIRSFTEDGYMENLTKDRDEVERDDLSIRGTLRWTPNDELDVVLKIEQSTFDSIGRQVEIIRDDPGPAGIGSPVNMNTILGSFGRIDALSNNELDFVRQADNEENSNNELNNVTLTADFELGEYTLTSTTGLVSYEFNEACDCDFVGTSIFDVEASEEYDQFSQELRLLSPLGETFDWVGGLFVQSSEMSTDVDIIVPSDSVLGPLVAVTTGIPAYATFVNHAARRNFQTDSDLWAAFFQGNWHITDSLEMTLGIRYTSEEKEASKVMDIIDWENKNIAVNPVAAPLFESVLGIVSEQTTGHKIDGTREETSFTPLLSLQYKASDKVMFYGSAVTGFKGGGFDAQANTVDSWEFEEEEATSYEIGMKSTLLDNNLEFNIAYYRTDYDNLQVSQFDGQLGFVVGNAKETRVQGIEIDGRWLLAEELVMNYSLAFLDHEYTDFRNGNCYPYAPAEEFGDVVDGVQLCDYTGKSGQYTPSITASVNFQYTQPVDFAIFDYMTATLGFYHSSSQNVDVNLNPLYEVDGYTKVDFRIALEGENYSIALFGRNVTDEEVLTYVGNTPLSATSFGTSTYYGFVARPASYGIQLTYEY